MESVGFKEWALVCEALGRGEQSILLRKGGIAEGRDGFAFKHAEFFLFPTLFHEQLAKTRIAAADIPEQRRGEIEIRWFARVDRSVSITEWEQAQALQPQHILREEVVRERFDYGGAAAIHVAFLRVFRLRSRWIFPDEPRYGGCRSWVNLPIPPADIAMTPVLSDDEHARRLSVFEAAPAPT